METHYFSLENLVDKALDLLRRTRRWPNGGELLPETSWKAKHRGICSTLYAVAKEILSQQAILRCLGHMQHQAAF